MIRREDEALEKLERLTENIKKAKNEMDNLKEREEGAYEREDESDKKLTFLTQEVHNLLTTAEEKERQVVTLERFKEKIKGEIDEEERKIQEVHDEIDKLDELEDL